MHRRRRYFQEMAAIGSRGWIDSLLSMPWLGGMDLSLFITRYKQFMFSDREPVISCAGTIGRLAMIGWRRQVLPRDIEYCPAA